MKIDRMGTTPAIQINQTRNNQQVNNENSSEIKVENQLNVQSIQNETNHDKSITENEGFEPDYLEKSIEQANKTLKQYNREILREVHETTKTVMYTIRDTKTHEVISEFPPKKIQDMIAKMWELAGLFVDEKA